MSQYFDKTFLKFLLGFIAIIATSSVLVIGARLYEASRDIHVVSTNVSSQP